VSAMWTYSRPPSLEDQAQAQALNGAPHA
jgi:hypothetical protein